MTTDTHEPALAPGYYWYAVDSDPFCVMHVHGHGGASLMGTAEEVSAHDLTALLARGCRAVRIEPPLGETV